MRLISLLLLRSLNEIYSEVALLDEINNIRDSLTNEIGTDAELLFEYAPSLRKLLHITRDISETGGKGKAKRNPSTPDYFQHLLQPFRRSLRNVLHHSKKIALFLEDVQNARKRGFGDESLSCRRP